MPFGAYQRIFRSPLEARVEMNGQSPLGCLLLIVVPALLFVSTYLAWWELRFFVQGRTTEAAVDRVEEIRLRSGLFGGSYRDVHYSFPDGDSDRLRSERDELPASWPRPDNTVRVEFVPGVPGGSRVAGHRHIGFTIFFVVTVIGSAVYGWFVLRDARRAVREGETFESMRRRARKS
jgi:hypothetical protein